MKNYVLIIYSPDSQGPGTNPVDVYGPETKEQLESDGHLLCDGSSGWEFLVVPEETWKLISSQPLQLPEWGDA